MIGEESLLQATLARVPPDRGYQKPVIVTSEESRFMVAAQLQETGTQAGAIILEPAPRNTAPAVASAALHVGGADPGALMLVMPADHHIEDTAAFWEAVAEGVEGAVSGHLVTFGVTPERAETGYGYIRRGQPDGGRFDVAEFVEKPDRARAEKYVADGDCYWNAGIFLFRCDRYLDALARARPEIHAASVAAFSGAARDLDFIRLDREAVLGCPAESIDHAVMENDEKMQVVPVGFGWSDIGSWDAVRRVGTPDGNDNVVQGDVMLEDCRGCYVRSDGRLAVAIGVRDLVVVETADAVLVCHRERDQEVRAAVERLEAAGRPEHQLHARTYRPWGYYEILHRGDLHEVRHILVNPGAKLSLQMHHHRAEHWVVVRGTAIVVRGEDEFTLEENESTYISLGQKHRLSNPGKIPLSLIEVQTGTHLSEDDIVRFEDIYNRI